MSVSGETLGHQMLRALEDLIDAAPSPDSWVMTGDDRDALRDALANARRVVVLAKAVLGGRLCQCGAPDDGHFPDCQFVSQGGTMPDPRKP